MESLENFQSADRVRNRTFRQLFTGPVRYDIPFFQRGYAWEKKQWDTLFEDITGDILPDLDGGTPLDDVQHFFGPVVVLEKMENGGSKRYLVIDGQQRLTTVYLLLGLIKERLEQLSHKSGDATSHALALRRLLTNDTESDDSYERLKLFSSKGDRLPTYWTLFGRGQPPVSAHYHTDVQLYQPGNNQVDEFRAYCDKKLKQSFKDVPALTQLAAVLLDSLRIVWIPLVEGKDDPQAIFESLNDKGMPLTSSELICSYLFRPLEGQPDFEQLHNEHWLKAIRQFDRRERFEEYLRCLFSIGASKTVGKGRKIYVHFKNRNPHLNVNTARHRLMEIHEDAKLYRMIVAPTERRHSEKSIARLLEAISNTRMESSHPFLLDLLRTHRKGGIDTPTAEALLAETLTMLVRRKMTEESTTVYDTMFPSLFAKVGGEPFPVKALQQFFKAAKVWTSDQDFETALIERTLYRGRDLAFTRMVLMEIDKTMQTHGQYPDYTTVGTIEHVIPQTLDSDWKKYLGADAIDPRLGRLVHSLGNLCLLSQEANSKAGQDPFTSKVEDYSEVTALARALRNHEGEWNLAAITQRSQKLAERAKARWAWSLS